ncbi:glycosyltransferase [uncultured Chitinophaga sp.]|uniref:glycosyltransferase family 2 protein n=1 Tax=uncultured Chitinophaga sp. TaxID=339340 RepID=UPI0025E5C236|nr:glycosyltransferase [uncultured Chitinophaga sp.]
MPNQPDILFSIVIPTYNRAEKLRQSLHALTLQTYRAFEVLVCDDGSTDHTLAVAKEFDSLLEIRYFHAENWGGPAKPRNTGIANARAEWICFLDSDDYWYPSKLEVFSRNLEHTDVLYHDFDMDNGDGKLRKMGLRQIRGNASRDLLVNGNTVGTSGACVRAEKVRAVGGFTEDKELIAVEDFDLWIRLAMAGCRFLYIPQQLGCYWAGGDNITAQDERQLNRINRIYELYVPSLNERDQRLAANMKAYKIARVYRQMGRRAEALQGFRKAMFAERWAIRARAIFFTLRTLVGR